MGDVSKSKSLVGSEIEYRGKKKKRHLENLKQIGIEKITNDLHKDHQATV